MNNLSWHRQSVLWWGISRTNPLVLCSYAQIPGTGYHSLGILDLCFFGKQEFWGSEWVTDQQTPPGAFPICFPTELSHAGLFCLVLTTWETGGISPARDTLTGQQAIRMERVGKSWGLLWRLRRAPGIEAHFYFIAKDPNSSRLGSRASYKSL